MAFKFSQQIQILQKIQKMAGKMEEDSRNNGRWTKEEHQKFVLGKKICYKGLQLYGKDWKHIQALIGSRNGAQIRSHAQKYFIKAKKDSEAPEHGDNWEQTKESPPEYNNHLSSLVHSSTDSQARPEYSYYLNKIVQQDALKETFDFWESLIDHKPLFSVVDSGAVKRKQSFVSLGCSEEEEEGDREGSAPMKRVKCE